MAKVKSAAQEAADELAKAKAKLERLGDRRNTAIAKATKKAEDNYTQKIADANEEVVAAGKKLQDVAAQV